MQVNVLSKEVSEELIEVCVESSDLTSLVLRVLHVCEAGDGICLN